MTLMNVKLWSVLVAGIATMVLGFLWYSPMLFARPWMVAMGYDPEDKAKIQEMQKSAGQSYAISFVASLVSAFVLGKDHPRHDGEHRPVRDENRLCHLAWLCDDRTAHRKTVRQPINQIVFDQYGISVGVLSGDGSDPGSVAAVVGSAGVPSTSLRT